MTRKAPFRVALISMPWSIFNRPSIQLATLKAFMEREQRDCSVDTFHPYLHIAKATGIDRYRKIAHDSWAGEALFSSLLFKSRGGHAASLFYSQLRTKPAPSEYDSLVELIRKECRQWLTTVKWKDYDLVGFSVCFSQLLPSLYMALQIKVIAPDIPILFGGSSCNGEIGKSLLDQFPQIDFLIDGEGDKDIFQGFTFFCDFEL
jgi:hypothetical protein